MQTSRQERAPQSDTAPARRIEIGPAARWLRIDGRRFDLERQNVIRRLALHLVEQRLARPGEACPAPELIEAAWPGEKMTRRSAMNRLYVAISTLRKHGLAGVLRFEEPGWLLDPNVAIDEEPELAA